MSTTEVKDVVAVAAQPDSLHVLIKPGEAPAGAVGAVRYIQEGSTVNFVVSYDEALSANGQTLAEAVLATCESDYATMQSWFGGITPPGLPFNVYIDQGTFGAYHSNCADTTLHLAAFDGTNADLVRMLLMAEVDEVFMAAQGLGWACGASHGEGLSRVLATELYPSQLDGFASAGSWLDGGRPNWVDSTEATDRNYVSIGCSTLFINFLRYELKYGLDAIVGAAAPTLAGVYQNLTGNTDAWVRFTALVDRLFPTGVPSGLTTDDPWPAERQAGCLVQGLFGRQGNFEVVQPAGGGGLVHFWRNNDDPAMPWSAPTPFATGLGNVDAVTMIESNYTRPGNLEVVARVGSELYFTWRDDTGWHDPIQLEPGVAGRPALIQGRFGTVGNFELVVPAAGGGLVHFWRNNDDPAMPWSAPTPFGTGAYDDISLIQSNYGDPGNLEVIAREGDKLDFYWRDSGPSFTWNGPYTIESGF